MKAEMINSPAMYTKNPSGMYALYKKAGIESLWRESASVTNEMLDESECFQMRDDGKTYLEIKHVE